MNKINYIEVEESTTVFELNCKGRYGISLLIHTIANHSNLQEIRDLGDCSHMSDFITWLL